MKVIVIKVPDAMKRQLDALRRTKGVNMSSYIRLAVAASLRRPS
jgi:ribbon-helix-helix CopG family protein